MMKRKLNFGRLLKRYLHDRLSGEEKRRLEAWLDSDKTDRDHSFIWGDGDADRLLQKINARIDDDTRGGRWWMNVGRVKRWSAEEWMQMAASLLLVLAFSWGLSYPFQDGVKKRERVASCNMKNFSSVGKAAWYPSKKVK